MTTKYKASTHDKIEKVDIVRETAKTVIIKTNSGIERKEHKTTEWYCYRSTFDEAKQWIVGKKKDEMERAKRNLEYATEKLHKSMALEEVE